MDLWKLNGPTKTIHEYKEILQRAVVSPLHKNWSFPLRILSVNVSHLLKKSLTENFIFCAVVFFYRSNHSQILFKKIGILKNFAIITRKNMCWSLFLIKLQAWKPQHKCFPVKISKFLRTAFLIENSFFPVAASRKWRISLLTLFHAGLNVVLPLRSRLPSFRLSWKPFWRGNSLLFL